MKRILPVVVLVFLSLYSSTAAQQAQMRVHYINVGQGDAILIEFPKAAVLIDAGGEETLDDQLRGHLLSYLRAFFARRSDLNRTIDTIIITHPHIDHTRNLPDIVREFRVKNLIDGGDTTGSGIAALNQARAALKTKARYFAAKDIGMRSDFSVPAFDLLRAADRDVGLRLLSGSRDCVDKNNDSLVVLVGYKNRLFLFTGDATSAPDEKCPDEISMLMERYQKLNLLKADVLKVNYHGSSNGTKVEWMRAIYPHISVISAGQSDPAHRGPGDFHAWQFGHPRETAVRIIQQWTSGLRPQPKDVITMKGAKAQSSPVQMAQAVYCTCWDGDIVVSTDGTKLTVQTSGGLTLAGKKADGR